MILERPWIAQTRRIIATAVGHWIRLSKQTTYRRTICSTNKDEQGPFAENKEYIAFEVSLNTDNASDIE